MKKPCAVILGIIVFLSCAGAQTYKKDDMVAMGGIGVFPLGITGDMAFPLIGAGFDYGVHDLVSGGAFFTLSGTEISDENHLVFSLAMKVNFHFMNLPTFPETAMKDKLDPYVGLMAGANIISNYQSRILWGAAAGCRYYLTRDFSVYLEAGYGLGAINAGVALKL